MSDLPVKPENAVNILRYILNNSNVSISEIVKSCSVGIQSASKTVRFFLDNSLLSQGLQKEKVHSGMRPERYRMNPKYNFITYSLSDTCFRARLVNADGKLLSSKTYSDHNRVLSEEEFGEFIRKFCDECSRQREEYRFGCVVVFSVQSFFGMEISDPKTLSKVRVRLEDTVRSVCGIRRVAARSREELAGEFFTATQAYSDKTVVYLCLNYDQLYSAATVCGQRIIGANGRGFCALNMMIDSIRTAHFVIQESNRTDNLADVIALICANARAFFDPHVIYLDTEDYKYLSGLAEIVNNLLHDKYDLSAGTPLTCDITAVKGTSIIDLGACTVLKELLVDDIAQKLRESSKNTIIKRGD